jgi:hypothetical protein
VCVCAVEMRVSCTVGSGWCKIEMRYERRNKGLCEVRSRQSRAGGAARRVPMKSPAALVKEQDGDAQSRGPEKHGECGV